MNIINGKFNPEELITVYAMNPPFGNIKDLSIYNSTPYFNIQKFYKNGVLVGYAVILLDSNNTVSQASLEDVVYWASSLEDLEKFLELVKKAQDYALPIEDIYYDSDKIDVSICPSLEKLGYKEKTKVR